MGLPTSIETLIEGTIVESARIGIPRRRGIRRHLSRLFARSPMILTTGVEGISSLAFARIPQAIERSGGADG